MKGTEITMPGRMEGMTNLRRDYANPSVLHPVGTPRRVCESSALPFGRIMIGERGVTFWVEGTELSVSVSDSSGEDAAHLSRLSRSYVGKLPGAPLLVQHPAPGVVRILMKRQQPVYLTYDNDLKFVYAGSIPQFGPLSISVTSLETIRGEIPSCRLTGVVGHTSGMLDTTDTEVLRKAALTAYASLRGVARRTGRYLQPVLARYRVLDASGQTLWRSPWIMPSATVGFQCTGRVHASCDPASGVTAPGAIEARSYMLQLGEIPELSGPWRRLAAKLVVEVTDEIEPIDAASNGIGGTASVKSDSTGTLSIEWYLPGCTAEKAVNPGLWGPLVIDTLAHAETNCRVAMEVDYPFEGHPAAIIALPASSLLDYQKRSHPIVTGYSAALETGDFILLANPQPLEAPDYAPLDFIIADNGGKSGQLSPLLAVPAAEASAITIRTRTADGGITTVSYPLRNIPGTNLCFWLSSNLATVPAGDILEMKIQTTPRTVKEGHVDVVRASEPGTILDSISVGRGEILTMKMALRSGAGWDFARRRIISFSTDGIWQFALGSDGHLYGPAMLDVRAVTSASAVTTATDTKGTPCIYVVAGGDLVKICATTVSTVINRCDAVSLGWCIRYGELWMASAQGVITLFTSHGERIRMLTDIFPENAEIQFGRYGGHLLVSADGELYDADDEIATEITRCRLRSRIPAAPSPLPLWLTVGISASSATGSVEIIGDNGTGTEGMLMAVGIHGAVNAPVKIPLIAPRRGFITVKFDLRLSADATVDSIFLANFEA